MNDKLYQKCKTILSEGTTGLTDDQATCNKIEALLPLLSNIDFQISQEYLPIIQPGLRIILQYWTKGPPSQSNKWSKSCLGLATILALLLPIDKINNGADYSKYAKLLGFVLAKVTAMGPV